MTTTWTEGCLLRPARRLGGRGLWSAFRPVAQTDAEVRLRILEGRRSRLEGRREGVRTSLARTRERLNSYTLELHRHGLEAVEREVRWLTELITTERHDQITRAGKDVARSPPPRPSP